MNICIGKPILMNRIPRNVPRRTTENIKYLIAFWLEFLNREIIPRVTKRKARVDVINDKLVCQMEPSQNNLKLVTISAIETTNSTQARRGWRSLWI
jgi:hypothetical protein